MNFLRERTTLKDLKRTLPWIGCGTAAGGLFTVSPGSGFVFVLVLISCFFFWKFTEVNQRRFVLLLFVVGFAVRSFLSLTLDGLAWWTQGRSPFHKGPVSESGLEVSDDTRRYMEMGDSDYYSVRGYALSQHYQGALKTIPRYYSGSYGWHGYLHIVGLFYTLFGYSPFAVKLINCYLGALLGPTLFFVAIACFNPFIAQWASVTVAFFPSLILWSTTNLKEPVLFLLTALLFLLYVQARKSSQWFPLLFYIVAFSVILFAHATMRSAVYPFALAGCLLASLCLTRWANKRRRILLVLLLLGGGPLLFPTQVRSFLAQSFQKHVGHVHTRGTTYCYLPKPYYQEGFLTEWVRSGRVDMTVIRCIGKAIVHYLLEPFPFRVNDRFLAMAYPQMVLWYFLLPFSFFGMVAAARRNFKRSLFLLSTLGVWTVIGSLTNGNVGTVFRARDMVTPYILLFAWVGVWTALHGLREAPLPQAPLKGVDASTG